MIDRDSVERALREVRDIYGNADIVSAGRLEQVGIAGGEVTLGLHLPTDDADVKRDAEGACRRAVKALAGVSGVTIMTRGSKPKLEAATGQAPPRAQSASPFDDQAPIEGVQNIIAVSSAKGGVGKSTVCVNLALALARPGARVGVMDADVYGPSVHLLLDVRDRPQEGRKKEIAPVVKDGLALMSLGFLTERDRPVIWRGPIVMGVVKKFLQDVDWGELDYLVVDMPPGTGDAQLTLVQTVPITGAVIVTTSSELALVDAEKGLQMYRTVGAPVLGIVENMSYFACPHCGERTEIFSRGGARELAARLGTEFLGEIPLDPIVRERGDAGVPIVKHAPDSIPAQAFFAIAERVRALCPA
ncbi:MAG: Mrp/NBP35 family ATP-binding protein [Candidatus Krumholzibacteria bacterium]|nr:Mrp/NBP35 family ATP-binding protein [Candidatus Krumholzibacteria bacterium]